MPYHQGEGGGITSAVKKKASEDKANLEKESTMLQGAPRVGSQKRRAAADDSFRHNTDEDPWFMEVLIAGAV